MNPHRARFAEVVRSDRLDLGLACLLIGGEVDPDLDQDAALARLDALAAEVRPLLPARWSAADAAAALRSVLRRFSGGPEDYADLRSSLLHEVLVRERGLPLLLAVVWLEVAARVDVPAYALALPGHVVVGIGDPDDEHVVVDAFAGGRPLDADLLPPARPAAPEALLLRLLTNVRALATRSDRLLESTRTHLWAVELSLLLPHHPLALRRERGRLLVRLGDVLGGAAALEEYALLAAGVADEQDEAEAARREARLARAQLN